MGDEKEPKEGTAGAEPSAETTSRADSVADAIRKAREKSSGTSKEKLITEAIEKSETEEMRRAMGLDIPFNVHTLLTRGVVEQRGMKITDDLYIDMHTLNKAEDVMAERLVEISQGAMTLSKAYLEAKTVAILTMAITRVNKERFPVPDLDPAMRTSDGWKTDWEGKQALMRAVMGMPSNDVDALMLVYANLDKMDVLVEEEARPKSSRP
jgi:hypothetical protein